MGVRPTHFQIGTIIITLDPPIESHHRTSSSPLFRTFLLSYVWVAMFNQFCTCIFSIHIIQYRLNVDLMQWCNHVTVGKVSRFDNGYLRFSLIW